MNPCLKSKNIKESRSNPRKDGCAEEICSVECEVLRICNSAENLSQLIEKLLDYLQLFTGCQAVGVRLLEKEDFPFYQAKGFTEKFLSQENKLCAVGPDGGLLRDCDGNTVLECVCGNVLRGRIDPEKPNFTDLGSFWSNCVSKLAAGAVDEGKRVRIRDRCSKEGYESAAFIPLRFQGETFGLFHFSDKRGDFFSREKIKRLENLVSVAAIALSRRKVIESLLFALHEKELLLREVNHRVKNNLQIINSLLNLQAGKIADEKTRNVLNDSRSRIKSIFLVHEKLYQTDDFLGVNVQDYISSLVKGLEYFFSSIIVSGQIIMSVEVDSDLKLGIDDVIQSGLIINELVTNAFKHAFPGGRKGWVKIKLCRLKKEGSCVLSVSDNGVGLPDGLVLGKLKTLGLELVDVLARQIGTIQIENKGGTTVKITFANGK